MMSRLTPLNGTLKSIGGRVSDIREIKSTREAERREEYAKMMEDVALQIREGKTLPAGVFVVIHWQDGELGKVYQCEQGYTAFTLVGIFEALKSKVVEDILGRY